MPLVVAVAFGVSPVTGAVTEIIAELITVKRTSKSLDVILLGLPVDFDTVTVAAYVPAASEVFGTTVKVVLPPTAIPEGGIDAVFKV